MTAVLNGVDLLPALLENVSALMHLDVEHVVVDGGSTDGSLELLREHQEQIGVLLPGPDGSISCGFNRGIDAASGHYVMILNVDDEYDPSAFERFVARLSFPPDENTIFYGDIVQHDPVTERRYSREGTVERMARYMSLHHMALAVPRNLHHRLGGYSEDYRLAMDSEFVHRCMAANVRFEHVAVTIGIMRLRGRSHLSHVQALREFERSVVVHGLQSPWVARVFRVRQSWFHAALKRPFFQRCWEIVRRARKI